MKREEIISIINASLADEFEKDASTFTENAPLLETLELDSLDLVDVIVLIEKKLGIKTAKEDFEGIKTFNDFYNFLESKTNK